MQKVTNKVKSLKVVDSSTFLQWDFNTLKNPKRDVTKLKNAIKKGGWSFPVIVWLNTKTEKPYVIDGAGRRKAVEELVSDGIVIDEIPYVEIEAKNLEEAKQKALEVSSQFGEITRASFELFTEGLEIEFDSFEIKGIREDMFIETEDKDEDVPEIPKVAQSQLGDLYELGGHRVLCGDATKLEDIEKLMNGRKADLWITDPPYNVAYEGKTKEALTIENDSMSDDTFATFLTDSFTNCVAYLKAGGVFYIWHADIKGYDFRKACKDSGLTVRQCLIWNKASMVMGRQDYQWKHEPCLYGWKDGSAHLWNSDRTQTTVLNFDKPTRNGEHPTMKPVELFVYQLTNNTKGEDIILDTFLGSGTTVIASEKTGRICYGIELDPRYVDVIVQRYVDFTGNENIIKNGEPLLWKTKNQKQNQEEEGDLS